MRYDLRLYVSKDGMKDFDLKKWRLSENDKKVQFILSEATLNISKIASGIDEIKTDGEVCLTCKHQLVPYNKEPCLHCFPMKSLNLWELK